MFLERTHHGQAIKYMLHQHLIRITQCGQVVGSIPTLQLLYVCQQLANRIRIGLQAQVLHGLNQTGVEVCTHAAFRFFCLRFK